MEAASRIAIGRRLASLDTRHGVGRGTQLFTACCVWQLAATCLCASRARAHGSRRHGATHRMACEAEARGPTLPLEQTVIPFGRISSCKWVGVMSCPTLGVYWACDADMASMQHGNNAKYGEAKRIANEGQLRPTTVRGIRALPSQLTAYMRPSPSRPSLP